MAEDKDKWRKYAHGVDNPRIEDGWTTYITTYYQINVGDTGTVVIKSWSINSQGHTVEKGKVLPYSLPSVGSRADPGVQAVNVRTSFT